MEVRASMFKNWRSSLERVEKFISPTYFHDVNLHGRLYPESRSVDVVRGTPGPNFPESAPKLCPSERQSFEDVVPALVFDGDRVKLGFTFGPTWSSHWFKVQLDLPEQWLGRRVHFRWNANCEGQIYNADGHPLQGLSGERTYFTLSQTLLPEERRQLLYIEVACNDLFGAGKESMIAPPDPDRSYTVTVLDVAVFDKEIYELLIDLETLHDLAKHLGKDNARGHDALYTANHMINTIVLDDRKTLEIAHAVASKFFAQQNCASQHTIVAIGNCHIDTAWLWPYGESIRKCARSWSSAVGLMERHPEMKFACSQAQQLYWVQQKYPSLFKSLQSLAVKGNFLPVGGTWVEMDGNIPSGESFIRQFLYGQQFFKKAFLRRCTEFWLPDTFGYSPQIPQLMKHCGAKYFVSQKLSWSLVNKFPHSSFVWEGLDGTTVLAHFPPADTYTAEVKVEELLRAANNLQDKGRVSESLLLYGHGDGGGGPTEDMLERAKRLRDVAGCPRLELGRTPEQFFERMEKEERRNLCRWTGELFLELHNGTYTTQAAMKSNNRHREVDLHDCEFLASLWMLLAAAKFIPDHRKIDLRERLDNMWRPLLLNQFHDVLPGSSIGLVHEEALKIYEQIKKEAARFRNELLTDLLGAATTEEESGVLVLVNTLPWERTEVVAFGDKPMVLVSVMPLQITHIPSDHNFKQIAPTTLTELMEQDLPAKYRLSNRHLDVSFDESGRIVSLKHCGSGYQAVSPGRLCNQFVLYDDVPLYWDAWDVMDYHLETGKPQNEIITPITMLKDERALSLEIKIGRCSRMKLKISLPTDKPYVVFQADVDWQENRKFLKVEFPVNVHSTEATYDIQFGHIKRPTHFNTSWDSAKYEVCGHKWMDLSEHNWGVAVLNDGKYGHAVHRNVMRLSLLRSPKSPDSNADMGSHSFSYAVMPHMGTFQEAGVIRRAYEFNVPLIKHRVTSLASEWLYFGLGDNGMLFTNHTGVIIETVKPAHDGSRALLARLYEANGGRCTSSLNCGFPLMSAAICNGLEDEIIRTLEVSQNNSIELSFTPFQVQSVLLRF